MLVVAAVVRGLDKGIGGVFPFGEQGVELRHTCLLGVAQQEHGHLTEIDRGNEREVILLHRRIGTVMSQHLPGRVQVGRVDPQAAVVQGDLHVLGDAEKGGSLPFRLNSRHHTAVQPRIADVVGNVDIRHGEILDDPRRRADVVVVEVGDDEIVDGGDAVTRQLGLQGTVVIAVGGVHQYHSIIHAQKDRIRLARFQKFGVHNVGGVLEHFFGVVAADLQGRAARNGFGAEGQMSRAGGSIRR